MESKYVICISNIENLYMTKGKLYRVYNESKTAYTLINDKTWQGPYRKEYFMDVTEHRDKQLKELGI